MAAEYDLIIVGATAAAQSAAIAAAQTYARTAWASEAAPVLDPLFLLREGSSFCQRFQQPASAFSAAADLISSAGWASPTKAQAEGVDYREGSILLSSEGLTVSGQLMRARAYLLALSPLALLPAIPGIIHPKIWTISQLYRRLLTSSDWPETIGVLGSGPQAIELSQSLQRLGLTVSLLTGGGPLLPQEDREMAFLLQTYLEGSGIALYSQTLLSIYPSADGLSLALDDSKLNVMGLVIATESSLLPESIVALNLRQTSQGLWVNSALQTSNPSIYACGSLLGGYDIPSLGDYEGQIAVRNALFQHQIAVRYHQLPYAVMSDPSLARVGLTEQQALLHDPDVQVIRQTFQGHDQTALTQAPAGLCKVLVQPDGTLLGAHLVGAQASDLIHLFAFALRQDVRLQDLDQGGFASPAVSEVIRSICITWRQQRSQQNRDRLEHGFLRQRSKS